MPHITRRYSSHYSATKHANFRPIDSHFNEDVEDKNIDNDSASPNLTSDNSPKLSWTALIHLSKHQFKGYIDEEIILTLCDYIDLATQLNLSDKQKSTHFANCLGEPAVSFYFMNTTPMKIWSWGLLI